MNILIKNANLISMSDNRDKYEKNIDIYIENGSITNIGKSIAIDNNQNIQIIDASNKIVMPGLINTHSHIPMSIFRETLDGYELQEWLENQVWPMEDRLTKEDIYVATLLSGIEAIKSGATTVNDMYFFTDEIIKAALTLGIRIQTTRTLMNINNDGDERLEELKRLIEEYKDNNTITFNAGIHGLYTSDEAYINKCIKFAKEYKMPIHMHFCENTEEVNKIKKEYGKRPVDVLKEYFGDVHTILAHCVKLEEKEVEELSKLNIHVSHCPISNLKLGCGVAKISKMVEKGINISIRNRWTRKSEAT